MSSELEDEKRKTLIWINLKKAKIYETWASLRQKGKQLITDDELDAKSQDIIS